MKKVIKLSESDLSRIIKRVVNEQENTRYMFFSNIEQMRRQCDILLEMDKSMVEEILENGHDWAQDHISEAKNNMDQVFDFLMNETESEDNRMDDDVMMEGSELTEKKKKNKPTNPGLWQQCLAWAKQRYEVCPSAYCNGAAVKRYNSKGGKWKKE
jgi:ferritin-like metal-binding protein YciE